jgi:hypothetical protein
MAKYNRNTIRQVHVVPWEDSRNNCRYSTDPANRDLGEFKKQSEPEQKNRNKNVIMASQITEAVRPLVGCIMFSAILLLKFSSSQFTNINRSARRLLSVEA